MFPCLLSFREDGRLGSRGKCGGAHRRDEVERQKAEAERTSTLCDIAGRQVLEETSHGSYKFKKPHSLKNVSDSLDGIKRHELG